MSPIAILQLIKHTSLKNIIIIYLVGFTSITNYHNQPVGTQVNINYQLM